MTFKMTLNTHELTLCLCVLLCIGGITGQSSAFASDFLDITYNAFPYVDFASNDDTESMFTEQEKLELRTLVSEMDPSRLLGNSQVPLELFADNMTTCGRDLARFAKDVAAKIPYTWKVLDAFGKPEADIFNGQLKWLGSYDACVAIRGGEAETEADSAGEEYFKGQYCLSTITSPTIKVVTMNHNISEAVCVPDTCSQIEVTKFINAIIGVVPKSSNVTVLRTVCANHIPISNGDIGAIVLCCLLVLMAICGTGYDVIRRIRSQMKAKGIKKARLHLATQDAARDTTTAVIVVGGDSGEDADYHPDLTRSGIITVSSVKSSVKLVHERLAEDRAEEELQKLKKPTPKWLSILCQALLSFSWLINGAKLLKPAAKGGQLASVNGIRTLSIWWVILGHTLFFATKVIGNGVPAVGLITRFTFQAITSAPFAVDSFFFLSGLLVSYLTLREMIKRKGRIPIVLYYFHRFWRLTPPYMFVLMLYCTLFLHTLTGPFMRGMDQVPSMYNCREYWWTNLIYINNFVPGDLAEQCIGWSWYLANDMQFYVISPLLLFIIYKNWRVGVAVVLAMITASVVAAGILANQYGTNPVNYRDSPMTQQQSYLYVRPYHRISPYLVGMLTAFILVKRQGKVHMNKYVVVAGWCLAGGIMMSLVYGLHHYYIRNVVAPQAVAATYTAMSRFSWSVALGWIVIACLSGYGGPINSFLSWGFWSPIGRLTYCAYLIHPLVMQYYYMTLRKMLYIQDTSITYLFMGHLVTTYLAAFVLSMLAEAPMINLEKLLLPQQRKKAENRKPAKVI